jgi:hypothetical protein
MVGRVLTKYLKDPPPFLEGASGGYLAYMMSWKISTRFGDNPISCCLSNRAI